VPANAMTIALIASGFLQRTWLRLLLGTGICGPLNKYGIEIERYKAKEPVNSLKGFRKD
jgi:hypothetical protein